ncbi:MAG: tetratricopeptide repeat protein [Pyrinomonadaceae bacterium]
MQSNSLLLVIIGLLIGFIGGFLLANTLNRSELNARLAEIAPANTAVKNQVGAMGEPPLTDAEIRSKIGEADKNPTNFGFQKDLGLALYRFAAMKQDIDILAEAARILERASSINPKDFDVLVSLGNAHFDIGFYRKDARSFETARQIYAKALVLKSGDPDVSTDLGLTYFLQDPPAYDRAERELQKVIANNPQHERSLQFLVQTLVKQGRVADAEKALARLKGINSANPAISDLTSQVSAARVPVQ